MPFTKLEFFERPKIEQYGMERGTKSVMMIDLEYVVGVEQVVVLGYSSLIQNKKRGISTFYQTLYQRRITSGVPYQSMDGSILH